METLHEASVADASDVTGSAASQVRRARDEEGGATLREETRNPAQQSRSALAAGPPESFNPAPGRVVFRLEIPSIDLSEVVVQGVEAAQLARGPGHYPECGVYFAPPYCSEFEQVWPGEIGRTVIGAHRTMAGAEFFDLGEVRPGDQVRIHASWGDFVYRVTRQEVVDDDDRSIIVPGVQARELVLVTCHPKFSSAQRLLTYARLVPSSEQERDGKSRSKTALVKAGI